ncbi:MAG: hypothetical protein JHC87_09845, partial [Thermoleophilaceae bacterium]|nr:hypothetical protein [Thermoleophilaceae bacterium]
MMGTFGRRSPLAARTVACAIAISCLSVGFLAGPASAELRNPRVDCGYYCGEGRAFDGGFTYSVRWTSERTFYIMRSSRPATGGKRIAKFEGGKYIQSGRIAAGGGQVAIELITDNRSYESASLTRVYRAAAGKVIPIGTLQDPKPAGICDQGERLVDVLVDGRVIVESNRMEGLNGACDVQHLRQTVTAVSPDGALQVLRESVSPWGVKPDGQQSTLAISGSLLFTSFPGGEIATANLTSGIETPLPYAVHKRFWELSQDGRMLTTQPVHKLPQTNLYANATDVASKVVLETPGQVSFFHFCGGQILEISRVGKRQSIKDGRRYWSLAR